MGIIFYCNIDLLYVALFFYYYFGLREGERVVCLTRKELSFTSSLLLFFPKNRTIIDLFLLKMCAVRAHINRTKKNFEYIFGRCLSSCNMLFTDLNDFGIYSEFDAIYWFRDLFWVWTLKSQARFWHPLAIVSPSLNVKAIRSCHLSVFLFQYSQWTSVFVSMRKVGKNTSYIKYTKPPHYMR